MSFRGGGRALLPFGLEYGDVTSGQTPEKPQLVLPLQGALSAHEAQAARQSIAFRHLVADGAFFTGSTTPAEQKGDGIQRHSDKYKKTQKIGRTIEEHPYQLEFFPEELYVVMGVTSRKRKMLSLSAYKENGGLKQYAAATEEEKAASLLEKFKGLAEDIEEGAEEEDVPEEEFDDEFEEDDDDDYNAEKYFDDGDEEAGDGDDEAAF
ncbi:DNA-directed RNA polymerase III subunit [[Candida] zeylanoides]